MTRIVPCHETFLQLKAITSWSIKTVLSVAEIESKRIAPKFGWVTAMVAMSVIGGLFLLWSTRDELAVAIIEAVDRPSFVVYQLMVPWCIAVGTTYAVAMWSTWVISSWRAQTDDPGLVKTVVCVTIKWCLYAGSVVGSAMLVSSFWPYGNQTPPLARYVVTLGGLVVVRFVFHYLWRLCSWNEAASELSRQVSIAGLIAVTTATAIMITLVQAYAHPLGQVFWIGFVFSVCGCGTGASLVAHACQSCRSWTLSAWAVTAIVWCVIASVVMVSCEIVLVNEISITNFVARAMDDPLLLVNAAFYFGIFASCTTAFFLLCLAGRFDRVRHERVLHGQNKSSL